MSDAKLHYGMVVPPFFGEARLHAANAPNPKLLINDAIKPIAQSVVDENEVTEVESDEYFNYVRQSQNDAQRLSEAIGDRLKAGKLLTKYVPNRGLAYYLVTNADSCTCQLAYRNYSGDCIPDRNWGYRTTLARKRCERLLLEDAMLRHLLAPDSDEQS